VIQAQAAAPPPRADDRRGERLQRPQHPVDDQADPNARVEGKATGTRPRIEGSPLGGARLGVEVVHPRQGRVSQERLQRHGADTQGLRIALEEPPRPPDCDATRGVTYPPKSGHPTVWNLAGSIKAWYVAYGEPEDA
jgi:hypothetical protein